MSAFDVKEERIQRKFNFRRFSMPKASKWYLFRLSLYVLVLFGLCLWMWLQWKDKNKEVMNEKTELELKQFELVK